MEFSTPSTSFEEETIKIFTETFAAIVLFIFTVIIVFIITQCQWRAYIFKCKTALPWLGAIIVIIMFCLEDVVVSSFSFNVDILIRMNACVSWAIIIKIWLEMKQTSRLQNKCLCTFWAINLVNEGLDIAIEYLAGSTLLSSENNLWRRIFWCLRVICCIVCFIITLKNIFRKILLPVIGSQESDATKVCFHELKRVLERHGIVLIESCFLHRGLRVDKRNGFNSAILICNVATRLETDVLDAINTFQARRFERICIVIVHCTDSPSSASSEHMHIVYPEVKQIIDVALRQNHLGENVLVPCHNSDAYLLIEEFVTPI